MGLDPREFLNDNEEAQRLALDGRQSSMWTAMPAIVQSVDLTRMTCVCQLAIQGRYEDQDGNVNWVNISVLQDVPIVFPSAGGFSITFPIAAGDEVLVVFASRCIDAWWQNGGYANKQMEYRMHDLSDGFAIPGPKSQPKKISSISGTNLQIRKDDGSAYIEITSAGKINLVGDVAITGKLTATGEITAKEGSTPIDLSIHTHTGVTTGSGNTGGPQG